MTRHYPTAYQPPTRHAAPKTCKTPSQATNQDQSDLKLRGERVLLIDADLRRPRIAAHLDLDNAVGLTTVLIGKASFDDAVQPQGTSGLDVLTSGPIPPNPSELLGFPEMQNLLRMATGRYDVVILDTPPLLPVTDAAILSRITSGALVVVGSRQVRRAELGAALESLERVEARILGLAFNKVQKVDEDHYGYGYRYAHIYLPLEASEPVQGPPVETPPVQIPPVRTPAVQTPPFHLELELEPTEAPRGGARRVVPTH